jgi:hypothetical protein
MTTQNSFSRRTQIAGLVACLIIAVGIFSWITESMLKDPPPKTTASEIQISEPETRIEKLTETHNIQVAYYTMLNKQETRIEQLETKLKKLQERYTTETKKYLDLMRTITISDEDQAELEKKKVVQNYECRLIQAEYTALAAVHKDLTFDQWEHIERAGFHKKTPNNAPMLKSKFEKFPQFAIEYDQFKDVQEN